MAILFVLSCNNGSQPKPTVPEDPEIPDLPQLESIYINKIPFRTTYEVDEKFDLSGLEVIAVYSDETGLRGDRPLSFPGRCGVA